MSRGRTQAENRKISQERHARSLVAGSVVFFSFDNAVPLTITSSGGVTSPGKLAASGRSHVRHQGPDESSAVHLALQGCRCLLRVVNGRLPTESEFEFASRWSRSQAIWMGRRVHPERQAHATPFREFPDRTRQKMDTLQQRVASFPPMVWVVRHCGKCLGVDVGLVPADYYQTLAAKRRSGDQSARPPDSFDPMNPECETCAARRLLPLQGPVLAAATFRVDAQRRP